MPENHETKFIREMINELHTKLDNATQSPGEIDTIFNRLDKINESIRAVDDRGKPDYHVPLNLPEEEEKKKPIVTVEPIKDDLDAMREKIKDIKDEALFGKLKKNKARMEEIKEKIKKDIEPPAAMGGRPEIGDRMDVTDPLALNYDGPAPGEYRPYVSVPRGLPSRKAIFPYGPDVIYNSSLGNVYNERYTHGAAESDKINIDDENIKNRVKNAVKNFKEYVNVDNETRAISQEIYERAKEKPMITDDVYSGALIGLSFGTTGVIGLLFIVTILLLFTLVNKMSANIVPNAGHSNLRYEYLI
jgi:hypothetical protein